MKLPLVIRATRSGRYMLVRHNHHICPGPTTPTSLRNTADCIYRSVSAGSDCSAPKLPAALRSPSPHPFASLQQQHHHIAPNAAKWHLPHAIDTNRSQTHALSDFSTSVMTKPNLTSCRCRSMRWISAPTRGSAHCLTPGNRLSTPPLKCPSRRRTMM